MIPTVNRNLANKKTALLRQTKTTQCTGKKQIHLLLMGPVNDGSNWEGSPGEREMNLVNKPFIPKSMNPIYTAVMFILHTI